MTDIAVKQTMSDAKLNPTDWLSLLDLDAVAEPTDKLSECQYFLELASAERQAQRFRWLVSAFFSAAYSFFEICAMHAFHAFTEADGEFLEDEEALKVLGRYVHITRGKKNLSFVKTTATHAITKRLYNFRRGNTHHFPLSIMVAGENLPADFEIGNIKGKGTPALAFCREVMELMRQVDQELRDL